MTASHEPNQIGNARGDDSFDDDFAAAFGMPANDDVDDQAPTEFSSPDDIQGLLASLTESLEVKPDAETKNAAATESVPSTPQRLPVHSSSRQNAAIADVGRPAGHGLPHATAQSNELVRLEFKGSQDAEVGMKSTLAIRFTAARPIHQYELRMESDLPLTPTSFRGSCAAAGLHDVGAVRFIPDTAGNDELRFELTLIGDAGVPEARLTGSLHVYVAPSQSQQSISAGGDVIIFGGRGPGGRTNSNESTADRIVQWQDIPLLEDASVRARLAKHRPVPAPDRPDDFVINAATARTNGVLYCRSAGTSPVCYALAFGTETSIGRGGDEEVHWWIRPALNVSTSFAKLSRRHITLSLKNGYAWITDHSANGSSLNGRRLAKGSIEVLSDGDRLMLADEMNFAVRLLSNRNGVSSLELQRADGLREFSSIVLALPGCPHQLTTNDGGFWVAWLETETLRLKHGAGKWQNSPEGAEFESDDGVRTAWYVFDGSVDQDQLF